jgi:hypothetical protein
MTKVQTKFKFSRALEDRDLKAINKTHSIYGLFMTRVTPTGDEILVEYDASRLSLKEVRGALEENGLPLTADQS